MRESVEWIGDEADDIAGSNGHVKPLVELKGKKLIYKEGAAPWSIPKRRELKLIINWSIADFAGLLKFSAFLLDAEEAGTKLTEFPSEFIDLVVMAGHEL